MKKLLITVFILCAAHPLAAMEQEIQTTKNKLDALITLDAESKKFLIHALTDARYFQKFDYSGKPIGPERQNLKYMYQAIAKDTRDMISEAGYREMLEATRKSQPHATSMIELLEQYLDLDFLEISARQQSIPLAQWVEKREGLTKQLMQAIEDRNAKNANELISAGADVNLDIRGAWAKPLYKAVCGGNHELVKVILAAGADVNNPTKEGDIPLNLALNAWNHEILKTLITAGADVYYCSRARPYGHTPLVLAAQSEGRATQIILDAICTLNPHEKDSIKNWFLINCRLRQERRGLPKDLKLLVAQYIHQSLITDMHSRLNRAGIHTALYEAQHTEKPKNEILLGTYLHPKFIESLVRKQLLIRKQLDMPN